MNMLREFFTSSSGLAPARQGLSLGWVISACVGVAILIGAGKAEAVSCPGYEILCDYNAYPEYCTEALQTRCAYVDLDYDCRRSIRYYFCRA